ncbi:toll/interleukin-1 receptor domain-containing protein [Frankia canadensis]|nr:toll/interleukin-1 receptor domain-containing protein [Frankia canadensis]
MVTDRLTIEEVRMLAQAFARPASATSLLERAGLRRSQHPGWSERTSLEFWEEVNHNLGLGALPDGRHVILAAALRDFPENPVFRAGVVRPPSTKPETAPEMGVSGDHATACQAGAEGVLVALDPVLRGPAGTLVPAGWHGLGDLIDQAARSSGLSEHALAPHDRGPRLLTTITGDIPAASVAALVRALSTAISAHNANGAAHRVRLRMALHRGRLGGGRPAAEAAAAVMYRLVDAPSLSRLLDDEPAADVVLIVSSALTGAPTPASELADLLQIVPQPVTVDIPAMRLTTWIGAFRSPDGRTAAHSGNAFIPPFGSMSATPERRVAPEPSAAVLPDGQGWDFVISAADRDGGWSEWLAWDLVTRDYLVHLQAWNVVPGHHEGAQLHAAISHARRMLVVLSPAYLRSPRVLAEWTAVWADDPNGMKRQLVPVRVEDCEPNGLLRGIAYIDLVGLTNDAAKAAFRRGIDASIRGWYRPRTAPPFPGPSPSPSP